ncbi:LolA-related protein [Roseateles sp. DC23W]|uniref:LolA-related protein n=1 Tax=Pelomonas dachongensis TaxID=3299029 RepID=A0ABW7EHC3_9BURK
MLLPDPPQAGRRACLALAMALLALGPGAALAQAGANSFDLSALMAVLSQRKSGEARFTEERTVSTLDYPLRASGRLTFQAPDRFARFTEEPTTESMEVQANQVLLKRGKRTRQMNLDAVPELAALAEAMRGTLGGDAAALQRHFRAQVSGNAARWVLRLTPLDSRLAHTVQQLEIAGLGADVRTLDLRLAGGDRSLMMVEPVAPGAASPTSATSASK